MTQDNLEGILFSEVLDKNGLSYATFREKLSPAYARVGIDIGKGYFFLILITIATIYFSNYFPKFWWLIIPVGALAIGYIAAYLALFIHEAGHFNIHRDKKINDRIATLFLCLPFGLSIKSYRKIHWQHHLHLGTPKDTEISYFNALTPKFFAETFTGVHLLKTIKEKNKSSVLTAEQKKSSLIILIAGTALHLFILSLAFLNNQWMFAFSWASGFVIFFPFFATIRQILEHRDEFAKPGADFHLQDHGKVSRLFIHTILNSSFGSAGFTRHMIHHWDPHMSYTRLKDIEAFLSESEKTRAIIRSSRTTYTSTLKKLLTTS